jgi:hypothetical protein
VATHLSAALPVAQGGTGAETAPAALAALGAAYFMRVFAV